MSTTDAHRTQTTPRRVRLISYATTPEQGEKPEAACGWLADQQPDVILWQGLHPDTVTDIEQRLGMITHVAGPVGSDIAVLLRDGGPLEWEENPRRRYLAPACAQPTS